jgi:hypothetical protein
MTDKTHLEEFVEGVTDDLSKKLVATFVEGHRDPLMKQAEIITRLKEEMEAALSRGTDAAD